MKGEPLRSTVTIVNSQGLHLRPMKAFVELASQFQSAIRVSRPDMPPADGKSPLALLGLVAEQGTPLTLEVSGPDQQAALDALVAFLQSLGTEDEESQ